MLDTFEWVLLILNVFAIRVMIYVGISARRRHKKHLLNLIFIRMRRMDPVVFVKRKKHFLPLRYKSKWVAVGTHDLGWQVGSNMGWREEMEMLDEYYAKELKGQSGTTGP